ncbi:MAG: hypothetical protein ACTHN5_14475 [Phycisphaerae bacterium]
MDSQQPGAKPQTSGAGVGVPRPPGIVRAYPKPPALLPRFVMLLLKPESWPAAAQYPFWVTLLPLILAVVIASGAVALSQRSQFFTFAHQFAANYDKEYPPLRINSDGVVSAPKDAKQPCDFDFNGQPFVVDTTGKSAFASIKGDMATLITDRSVYQRVMGQDIVPQPLAESYFAQLVPEKGEPDTVIDSRHITKFLADYHAALSVCVVMFTFAVKFIAESVWIVVMLFLLQSAIMVGAAMGEKRLIMPRRALYRIGAALLVPVVVFAGITQAVGYSAASVVGGENALILWFFACSLMGVWAGHMAQQMYTPRTHRPRQR